MKFCFKDANGKKICIYPFHRMLLNDWWRPRPEPDPRTGPTDPSPWRMIEHEAVRPEIIEDLTKLAALDELAASLSSERAKPIQAAIRAAVPRDLPNIEVSF